MNVALIRRGFVSLVITLVLVVIFATMCRIREQPEEWSLSAVAEAAKEGRIDRIIVTDTNQMRITLVDGNTVVANKDSGGTAIEQLRALGVTVDELTAIEWQAQAGNGWSTVWTVLLYLMPLIIVVMTIYVMLRGASKQQPPSSLGS